MASRLSMTGEVIDAARAETMGLVTEVVAHARLLDRTVELATHICEVDAPIMQGLRAIYMAGAAGNIDGLGERYRQLAERNRRQIRRPG
jgi:enoyl-CoA hydratase